MKFDIFHMGYPCQQELGVLAKLLPNVDAGYCWAHIISPSAARHHVARVLAAKVQSGLFSENAALETGRLLLRDHGLQLFNAATAR